ncbi:MAG TPA: hypothetical protein VIQ03_14540 [Gammaproteobacteria bacterium]
MNSISIKTIKFSINSWSHLYSLEQAIERAEQATGKHLSINGIIRKEPLFNDRDTPITISFDQVDGIPDYHTLGQHKILGQTTYDKDKLTCSLPVDERVFEELRKNLMEYADIDGIHIVVTLGLILQDNNWPQGTPADIVKLDYAMRGDA